MTLKEITHSILEVMRGGAVVDDERLDTRLIEDFVVLKRAEFIMSKIERRHGISENYMQTISLDLESYDYMGESVLRSTEYKPFLRTRYGLSVSNVSTKDNHSILFKYVPYAHFKFSGNSLFNRSIVFVTVHDNGFLLKSKNPEFKLIDKILITGVLQDPKLDPDFNKDEDDYPIDYDGIQYIKNEVLSKDIRLFMSGVPDEVNDASGEIIK